MFAAGKVIIIGLLWWILTSNVAMPPVISAMVTVAVVVITVAWVFGTPPTNRIN